jgi:hypothetical protein
MSTGDEAVNEIVKDNDESGMKVVGVPDHPYSLMEGIA